jgi:hypothetical protein
MDFIFERFILPIVGFFFILLILAVPVLAYIDYDQSRYLCERYYKDIPISKCIWMKKRLIPGTKRVEIGDTE